MHRTSSCRNVRLPFLFLTLATTVLTAGTGHAQGTFVSFDGPHAGTQQYHGTFPVAISPWGGVVLMTIGDDGVAGAYVRRPNGSYLQIQPPPGGSYPSVAGINARGQVAGAYWDSQNNELGFIRNADGTYVTVDPPGSNGQTTIAGINDRGQVAGNAEVNGAATPFFWEPGNYVTFSVPGGTYPRAVAINNDGQIAGSYGTSNYQSYGFLRKSDGTLSSFIIAGNSSLQVNAMNNWGTIVGSSFDSNGSAGDTFLRYAGGGQKYIYGDSHGAVMPAAISDKGIVVGTDFGGDTSYGNAFSADRNLTLTLIPVPFTAQGSTANGVNKAGQIVGTYIDANGASHGWIYLP
jgi:uncharacterized membrane protein